MIKSLVGISLSLLLVMSLVIESVAGQPKHEDVVRLVKLMGVELHYTSFSGLAYANSEKLCEQLKRNSLTPAERSVIEEEFLKHRDVFVQDRIESCAEVLAGHLDSDEVQEMISLYEQPIMRKYMKLAPEIMEINNRRDGQALAAFMEKIFPRIVKRLRTEFKLK